MKTIIQLTKKGTIFTGQEQNLELMKLEFDKQHCIKLPRFLETELLQFIQQKLQYANFCERNYKDYDVDAFDLCLKDKTIKSTLEFLANDQNLFKLIQHITGCPEIGCFTGGGYSMNPGYGHYDSWHNDLSEHRMIAMSINLSNGIYSGGFLQIRDAKTKKILHEITNTGFGDCVIFRISPSLEHRVTKVKGKVARTVLTGWFRSKPSYTNLLKKKASKFKSEATPKKLSFLKDLIFYTEKELFYIYSGSTTNIFNPRDRNYYSTDPIGTEILNLLHKPRTIDEIRGYIQNKYLVKKTQCDKDVLNLLHQFAVNNLIISRKTNLAGQKK